MLVAMWFFSGVVMMYVGFPTLTVQERFAGLPALDTSRLNSGPNLIVEQIGSDALGRLRLTTIAGSSRFRCHYKGIINWIADSVSCEIRL